MEPPTYHLYWTLNTINHQVFIEVTDLFDDTYNGGNIN